MRGPREIIHRCPATNGEIVLRRCSGAEGDTHYEVILNGAFLFSTYNRESERALARLAIEGCHTKRNQLSILIGGLGTGYTLQAALEHERTGQVTLIEREETVIEWGRTFFSEYNGGALEDLRVSIKVIDFLAFTRASSSSFDAVCVDLDNGPHWVTWEGNRALYEADRLEEIKQLLSPGGCFSIWSSRRDQALEGILSTVFGEFTVYPVRCIELGRENAYTIYRTCT